MSAPLPIAACRLELGGAREQHDRYRSLGAQVADAVREPGRLVARFNEGIDPDLVAETIAVERQCCTFFDLAYEAERRELTVSVADRGHDGALDAIAEALGMVPSPSTGRASRT